MNRCFYLLSALVFMACGEKPSHTYSGPGLVKIKEVRMSATLPRGATAEYVDAPINRFRTEDMVVIRLADGCVGEIEMGSLVKTSRVEGAKRNTSMPADDVVLDAPDAYIYHHVRSDGQKLCAAIACQTVGGRAMCLDAERDAWESPGPGGRYTSFNIRDSDCADLVAIMRSLKPL